MAAVSGCRIAPLVRKPLFNSCDTTWWEDLVGAQLAAARGGAGGVAQWSHGEVVGAVDGGRDAVDVPVVDERTTRCARLAAPL